MIGVDDLAHRDSSVVKRVRVVGAAAQVRPRSPFGIRGDATIWISPSACGHARHRTGFIWSGGEPVLETGRPFIRRLWVEEADGGRDDDSGNNEPDGHSGAEAQNALHRAIPKIW
ncbi:MAG TPA: hypothetical protein VHD86_17300 [Xanthobacteraceae bacterium]|nr:hypothetical protein [Xanthobacteraceae bacterium]